MKTKQTNMFSKIMKERENIMNTFMPLAGVVVVMLLLMLATVIIIQINMTSSRQIEELTVRVFQTSWEAENFRQELDEIKENMAELYAENVKLIEDIKILEEENENLRRQYEEIFGEIDEIKYEAMFYNGRLSESEALQIARSVVIESRRQGFDSGLISRIIFAESTFRPQVVSPAGAQGLMQLMPGTAKYLGVEDPFDIEQNIRGGVKYLAEQHERFGGDVRLALSAYNAGPGNVSRYGNRVPPFRETRVYVEKIVGDS